MIARNEVKSHSNYRVLRDLKAPNKACSGFGGIRRIFESFLKWSFSVVWKRISSRPQTTTDYLQCQGFSGKLSKVHPREPFSLAVFFIQPGFSFFRERFAAPDTLSFLSGFKLRFFSTAFLKIPRKYKNENSRLRSTGVLPVDERRSRFRWGVSPFYPNFVYGKALLLSGYAGIPSSAMRARTSSLGASRLGTSLRTKRVMSFSTPSFSSAYLANCL